MRRGFTLLELIIVIVILGVLATLGFAQYQRMVERARGAEARTCLGYIRTAGAAHRVEYGVLDASIPGTPAFDDGNLERGGLGDTADTIPWAGGVGCRSTHYFVYTYAVTGPDAFQATAIRCGAGGKTPDHPTGGTTLILTTNFAAGTDQWTGTGGY